MERWNCRHRKDDMIPFPFNESQFSFFIADHLLLASCVQIPIAIGAFYHVWKWHNVHWARSEMRHYTTYALNWSKVLQQDHCQHPQNANPDNSTLEGTAQRIRQAFRWLRLWSLVWFQVRATSCHLTSLKSVWMSTPKCTWMYWRVWWSPAAIRWPVADPGCGSRMRRRPTNPKRPRFVFRRSATTLYPSLTGSLLPRPEPAGLLCLVIRREHHQHDLPQHQSQPDCHHPPSICQAPASACGKGMLPVPDPYQGGDWGWRKLHWIDVSSTT